MEIIGESSWLQYKYEDTGFWHFSSTFQPKIAQKTPKMLKMLIQGPVGVPNVGPRLFLTAESAFPPQNWSNKTLKYKKSSFWYISELC